MWSHFRDQTQIYFKYMHHIKQVSHQLHNWHFSCQDGALSPSEDIEKIAQECQLFRAPSIIFGDNFLKIKENHHNVQLIYNAKESLHLINFQARKKAFCSEKQQGKVNTISFLPGKLLIKHADHWKNLQMPKNIEITEIQETSDSFFVTSFKGLVKGEVKIQKTKDQVIPLQKLGPQNQIKFYHQGSLYEDELDDNGLIQYEYKFRSMASSWFALIRCYARIDQVFVQILDTRIYWEEGWNKIARQFMVKSCTWTELKDKGYDFANGWTMNPNQSHLVYQFLDEKLVENEYIHFK